MRNDLDQLDTVLLNAVQAGIPLVERPFAELAKQVEGDEAEVLRRLNALKTPPRKIIRQISAIFDTKALGYESSLVAARVAPERLDEAAAIISAHPGVTHNYQRNHAFNLWYTCATPPTSALGLQRTVELLHTLSGAFSTRMFPTLKLYKIGVSFDMGGETAPKRQNKGFSHKDRAVGERFSATDADHRLIRVLQQDLPLIERPWDDWASDAGVSVEQLLDSARAYEQRRWMRRFSAVLHHREAGFSANGMGCWVVPEEKREAFGATAATFAAVSHCYLRPTYADWPYSIFTMVHGTSQADCEKTFGEISAATGVKEFVALYSSREFKKTRLKYFTGDVEAWEKTIATDGMARTNP